MLPLTAGVTFTLLAPHGWPTLLHDGIFAAIVHAAAAGWGLWPARWLLGRRIALREACVAAALGAGLVSSLVLAIGCAGLLSTSSAWCIVAAGVGLGLARVYRDQDVLGDGESGDTADAREWPAWLRGVAATPAGIALGIALFCACLPPGILWTGEGGGYDVLEYHLQGPREYWMAGRIQFLPHNVYTSFPQLVEMQYLLLMHLLGDPHAAAIPAQLLHLGYAALFVVAVVGRSGARWQRIAALLLAGTSTWLVYLGSLAYVECAMLFIAAVAGRLALEAVARVPTTRDALLLGLLGGIAGGTKYTALAMVGAALALTWLAAIRANWRRRTTLAGWLAIGALAAFAPWMVRNAAFTGNPVYPFAYRWLGGAAWSPVQEAQWSRAHRPKTESDTIPGRLTLAAGELFGTRAGGLSHFGPVLFIAAVAGLWTHARRAASFLALWAMAILAIWIAGTHLPARFAVPLLTPLLLLAVGGQAANVQPWRARAVLWLAILAAALQLVHTARLLASENVNSLSRGAPLSAAIGRTDLFLANHPLNVATPPDARIWLVGNAAAFYIDRRVHYTVAFNRDPWIDLAAGGANAGECVRRLREQGVTHVCFTWAEIERLRSTYGFPGIVTRAWVDSLVAAGLRNVPMSTPLGDELFEVP